MVRFSLQQGDRLRDLPRDGAGETAADDVEVATVESGVCDGLQRHQRDEHDEQAAPKQAAGEEAFQEREHRRGKYNAGHSLRSALLRGREATLIAVTSPSITSLTTETDAEHRPRVAPDATLLDEAWHDVEAGLAMAVPDVDPWLELFGRNEPLPILGELIPRT